jgi:hypothetical protein
MGKEKVIIFQPYPLEVGQKIYIDGGPRRGDWKVIGVDEKKVRLQCPITFKEVEWTHFCFFVEAREDSPWPHLNQKMS